MLLSLVLALQAPSIPSQTTTLGTYTIGGREVAAVVPSVEGPIKPSDRVIEVDGVKYLIGEDGRFKRKFRAQGGWSEVREGYAAAKAAITPETPEWRVKAFVLPRSNILDVAESGLARERQSMMEGAEITHVVESLARFAAMAEAAGRGKIRIRVDMEVDADPVYQTATKGKPPFGAEFLAEYLKPRINGGLYQAEDRIYRGPFDSVFVIHGGFSSPTPMAVVNDTAVSPIAFYAQGWPLGNEALSLALYDSWVEHLAFAAKKSGYRIPSFSGRWVKPLPEELAQGYAPTRDPDAVFKGSMWGRVFARSETPTQAFVQNRGTTSGGSAPWSEIAADPFSKLGPYDARRGDALPEISVVASPDGHVAFSDPKADPFSKASVLELLYVLGSNVSAIHRYGEGARQLTFVEASFAELFGRGMASSSEPKAIGWIDAGGIPFIVFDSAAAAKGQTESALLDLPGIPRNGNPAAQPTLPTGDVAVEFTPKVGTAAAVPVTGGVVAADAVDPVRGDVLSLKYAGLIRLGGATLVGSRSGPALFDSAEHPYLSLHIKPQKPEPMELVVVAPDGTESSVGLFGQWPNPAEMAAPALLQLPVDESDSWKHIVLDLRKIGAGRVSAIELRASRFVGYWPAEQALPPVILVDDLKVSKAPPEPEMVAEPAALPEASPTSESPEGRAAYAAAAADASSAPALIELLKDPTDLVRLNAARALARIKTPAAEAALIESTRSLSHRVAEAAIEALAELGTPAAWEAIERAVRIGPFDHTRLFAARAYPRSGDPKLVPTLSLMLTSKPWLGRQLAAEGIGPVAKGQQQLVLMAFLVEIDPSVRLAATKAADSTVVDVCKRILWSAVNDPSDEVRAWSCWKLIQSGLPQFVGEGLKGVRDESMGMRIRLLELMRDKPSEAIRPALRLAVADASPSVRAAALRTFAVLPGEVKAEEVENTLNDPDPRVKSALEELKKAKGF